MAGRSFAVGAECIAQFIVCSVCNGMYKRRLTSKTFERPLPVDVITKCNIGVRDFPPGTSFPENVCSSGTAHIVNG